MKYYIRWRAVPCSITADEMALVVSCLPGVFRDARRWPPCSKWTVIGLSECCLRLLGLSRDSVTCDTLVIRMHTMIFVYGVPAQSMAGSSLDDDEHIHKSTSAVVHKLYIFIANIYLLQCLDPTSRWQQNLLWQINTADYAVRHSEEKSNACFVLISKWWFGTYIFIDSRNICFECLLESIYVIIKQITMTNVRLFAVINM